MDGFFMLAVFVFGIVLLIAGIYAFFRLIRLINLAIAGLKWIFIPVRQRSVEMLGIMEQKHLLLPAIC